MICFPCLVVRLFSQDFIVSTQGSQILSAWTCWRCSSMGKPFLSPEQSQKPHRCLCVCVWLTAISTIAQVCHCSNLSLNSIWLFFVQSDAWPLEGSDGIISMEKYSWRVHDGIITMACQVTLRPHLTPQVLKLWEGGLRLIISYVHLLPFQWPASERGWKETTPDAKYSLGWLFVVNQSSQKLHRCQFTKIRETKRENDWKPIYTIIKSGAVNNYQISFPRKHKSVATRKALGQQP